jgi:hypothetical protein
MSFFCLKQKIKVNTEILTYGVRRILTVQTAVSNVQTVITATVFSTMKNAHRL